MKKRLVIATIAIVALLALLSGVVVATLTTPYHSVDTNCYEDVRRALRHPEWTANFARSNFQNVSDIDQFSLVDYPQSAPEMFHNKKGDCEDYVAFFYACLDFHGYEPEAYAVGLPIMSIAHVVLVYPYDGKWAMMDNIFGLRKGFETKIDALNGSWLSSPELSYNPYSFPQGKYPEPPHHKRYIGSDRFALDAHLTECDPGFYFYTPTFGYLQALHKEAIGFLSDFQEKELLKLKAIGLGITDHGFYSSSDDINDRVYNLYLLWPRVGVSIYGGDYNGVDVDLKLISHPLLKSYVCVRNFGEVIDYKLSLFPSKLFNIDLELNDKEFRWVSWLRLMDGKVGIGVEKNGIQFNVGPLTLIGRKEKDTGEIDVAISLEGEI